MRAINEYSEDRLHQVEQDVRRAKFDSRIRTLKTECPIPTDNRPRETDEQVDRLVGLLEVLAERVTGLDRKTRNLTEELRLKDRRDRKRLIIGSVIVLAALLLVGSGVLGGRSGSGPLANGIAAGLERRPR